jgi:hypothetical protein
MLNHLIKCESVTEHIKKGAEAEKIMRKNMNTSTSSSAMCNITSSALPTTSQLAPLKEPPVKRQQIEATWQNLTVVAMKHWTPGQQHDFTCDLCDLFVTCGIPWNAANNPQTYLFAKKWIPGAEVPDC